jgi:hypothetical protein
MLRMELIKVSNSPSSVMEERALGVLPGEPLTFLRDGLLLSSPWKPLNYFNLYFSKPF